MTFTHQRSPRHQPTTFGISDTGEIAGFYDDLAGTTHGFIYANGAFSTVDVAGARGSLLTRIKNGGSVTGVCTDAVVGNPASPVNKQPL